MYLRRKPLDYMFVVKRDGLREEFDSAKIFDRLETLKVGFGSVEPLDLDFNEVVVKAISGLCDEIKTVEIDNLLSDVCAARCTEHPSFEKLASRLVVSNLHKETPENFYDKVKMLYKEKKVSKELYDLSKKHFKEIEETLNYERDYLLNYFGLKTLMRSYLLKGENEEWLERPQDMFMRVSLGIHGSNIKDAMESYNLMSNRFFTHATPTLFNAGTNTPQMSSCFLLDMVSDSINGIYETLHRCALISKNAGGIGVHIHCIRSSGSKIRGTNGTSNGIVPMLRVFNSTAKYVDQGGNKRPGTIAAYIEPWHPDIFEFIELRKNTGNDELRARDLFLGLWIPDLFMERVEKDENWSLFCPDEVYEEVSESDEFSNENTENGLKTPQSNIEHVVQTGSEFPSQNLNVSKKYKTVMNEPKVCGYEEDISDVEDSSIEVGSESLHSSESGSESSNASNQIKKAKASRKTKRVALSDVYGDEFRRMYESFEKAGKARKVIRAQHLWKAIIEAQIETGTPYMLYKDSCNEKNNQKNLGTLRGSNLCTEILEFTSPDEIAVCNLASIGLPMFIKKHDGSGDEVYSTENGDFVFDYEKLIQVSGIITRNLDRVIDKNYYPVPEARKSNLSHRPIGIGIQGLADCFAILRLPFESDEAKHLNKRIFECIYYGALKMSNSLAKELGTYSSYQGSPMSKGILQFDMWENVTTTLDWEALRRNIKEYGTRNSLLVAPMPTASTSQILGFNECIEPFTSNIYSRRTLAGQFQMVNKYLLNDLIKLGLWNPKLKNMLIEHEGSIQNIPNIPENLKMIYKTAWEIKMRVIIDMAADRSPFIDQSQSLNLFVAEPTYTKLTSMHFHSWKKGLKTGMYYLRTRPIASAIKFTVNKEELKDAKEGVTCQMEDGCMSCSG